MNRDTIKRRLIEQETYTQKFLDEPLIQREHFSNYQKTTHHQSHQNNTRTKTRRKNHFRIITPKKTNFYYVNFDDEILSTLKREDLGILLELLNELFGKRSNIFLDEI
jgi:hypothetical protein